MRDFAERHNRRIQSLQRESSRKDKKDRHKNRLSKFDRGYFIAWDGEGLENPGGKDLPQLYALLANSEGEYILNPDGLSTTDCLNFLTSNDFPNYAINVCFGASYDVNMMLKDLPETSLRKLHSGDKWVKYGEFELEYRPRKSFTVRRYKMEERNGKRYKVFKKNKIVFERVVTLWDVLGFFQKKFTKVLEEWLRGTEYETDLYNFIHDIQAGKDRRGSFSADELEGFILPYTIGECTFLRYLMGILHRYLHQAGLVLTRWDGAGAVAAAFLKKYNIKEHIVEPPDEVTNAAEHAYFGGWMEAFLYGIINRKVYHYDIKSAYPATMLYLPSLAMGHWECKKFGSWKDLRKMVSTYQFPSFWMAHIYWDGAPTIGPGPFHWRHTSGNVMRPPMGIGWHWSPEIEAVIDCFPDLKIGVDAVYFFVPNSNCTYPFQFIKDVFELRQVLETISKGTGIIYKLGPNSIYGKLAQSLGYNPERNRKPPYHSIVYAGLITSMTRAKLLRAAMQAPDQIIFVATDGIYSLMPLDLEIGTQLGQWEYSEHDSMVVVQSGFYWAVTDGKEKHYYRGMNEGAVTMEQVVSAYHLIDEQGYYRLDEKRNQIDSIPVPVTRFITIGGAVGLNDFSKWRTWRTTIRNLDINMQTSFKRKNSGIRRDEMRISECKLDKDYAIHPKLWESTKYKYEWDERHDGEPIKQIVEEMFHMELSPMGSEENGA